MVKSSSFPNKNKRNLEPPRALRAPRTTKDNNVEKNFKTNLCFALLGARFPDEGMVSLPFENLRTLSNVEGMVKSRFWKLNS
jgi:hypothetical protein